MRYGRLVGNLVRMGVVMLAIYAGLMALASWQFHRVPTGFIPPQDQGYLIVSIQLPSGASLSETDKVVQDATRKLLAIDGVANTVVFTGFSGATRANASNAAAIFPTLDSFEKREQNGILFADLLQKMRAEMGTIKEASIVVIPPPPVRGIGNAGGFRMMIQDRGGRGLDVLNDAVAAMAEAANDPNNPATTSVVSFFENNTPQIYLDIDREIVVDERFVLRIPANLDLAGVAPLLCTGITTYSPMSRRGVTQGQKVGVVGLGGLGHMGVKFARAFGAHVVVFTTSPSKSEDAFRPGAHEVVISTNLEEMQKHAGSFDFILDTIAAEHDLNAYINLLARDSNLTLVGAPEQPLPISAFALLLRRRSLSGSLIGGIAETQEMLDFCGEHNITADVEVIPIQRVNEAYERLLKSDVKYRFSIDMASLKD